MATEIRVPTLGEGLYVLHCEVDIGITGVPQHDNSRHAGHQLAQHLEPFFLEL